MVPQLANLLPESAKGAALMARYLLIGASRVEVVAVSLRGDVSVVE